MSPFPDSVSLVECPRDAMQGWPVQIPTAEKISYLQSLLAVGFESLDFGSFVSARAIPQMADTREVLQSLSLENSNTRLLAIVANLRGAEEACALDKISVLGYPFSVSETFQQRNTNHSITASMQVVQDILDRCHHSGKELVVYLSMAFGNPYRDPYSEDIVHQWADALIALGVKTLSLADTVGLASAAQVFSLTSRLVEKCTDALIGVHLHSAPANRMQKIDAAFQAGCRRFDGALRGIGGCPMAGDELVGNMDTLVLLDYLQSRQRRPSINETALAKSLLLADKIFSTH